MQAILLAARVSNANPETHQAHRLSQSHTSDWTPENWTSKLRADHGLPRFGGAEKGYLNFAYLDSASRRRATRTSPTSAPRGV